MDTFVWSAAKKTVIIPGFHLENKLFAHPYTFDLRLVAKLTASNAQAHPQTLKQCPLKRERNITLPLKKRNVANTPIHFECEYKDKCMHDNVFVATYRKVSFFSHTLKQSRIFYFKVEFIDQHGFSNEANVKEYGTNSCDCVLKIKQMELNHTFIFTDHCFVDTSLLCRYLGCSLCDMPVASFRRSLGLTAFFDGRQGRMVTREKLNVRIDY